MPHVALVPFTGFRVREAEMLALGMSLPGLKQRGAAVAQLPALGLLTLAGLTPGDWTTSYHEAAAANEALEEEIVNARPTLVALSALTASIDEAYRLSVRLQRRGVLTVVGGLHATACHEEARQHCNAVVIGDGEPVWSELLADAEAGELRPVYRASAPFDLAQSPVPRFDLVGHGRRPRLTVQTQRGCPLACDFCGASRLLGPHRLKPISNLKRELAEIGTLVRRPILELADDNTFVGRRDAQELLEELASTGARYFTEVDWRTGENPSVLANLARSGCVQVLVGIESLVFRHPGMGVKRAELPRIMNAIEAIQSAGIAVNGCFIVGCDGETHQSIERLGDFIQSSTLADVQLTLQTPFPGTALHRRLQREGRRLSDRGWAHYTLFDVTYEPDSMSVAELESAFRNLVRRVHSAAECQRRETIRERIWRQRPGLCA